jgi:hypothetical protein
MAAGDPVLFLDARSALAWNVGDCIIRGAVRIRPARLAVDLGWQTAHLTVIY